MTQKNFLWTVWRIKPLGGPRRDIWGTLFTFAQPFHSCPLIAYSDYVVCWANGSVPPFGARDEIAKAAPWEISRRARAGVHREALPKVP